MRESDIQIGLGKMESEMLNLSSRFSSSIETIRKQATSQVSKSQLLATELKSAREKDRSHRQ